MRMILMKTNLTVRNAKQLNQMLNEGYAVHRITHLPTVFHFIGYDGEMYSTDNTGACQFCLRDHPYGPVYEDYHEYEVYEIEWLAFNHLPISENSLISFQHRGENHTRIVNIPNGRIEHYPVRMSPEFIMYLLRYNFNDIWIRFLPVLPNVVLPLTEVLINNGCYLRLLMKDNSIINGLHGESLHDCKHLHPEIFAYQIVKPDRF